MGRKHVGEVVAGVGYEARSYECGMQFVRLSENPRLCVHGSRSWDYGSQSRRTRSENSINGNQLLTVESSGGWLDSIGHGLA